MRILQVMAGAEHGGAETAFVDMCLALHEQGITQEVITRPNDLRVRQLRGAGLKVHLLPFGGKIDIFTPWSIQRVIGQFKPDIVQTWMARAAAKTPASPVPKRWLKVSRLGGYYDIKYFKTTDYFQAITPDIKKHLVNYGVPESHVVHINNFAEMEQVIKPVLRADFQTPDNAVVLLTLSRLHTNKALDVLLQSIVDIPNAYVWLAGEGPERENLQSLSQALGIADRVRFLGWRDDRAALLQACDICVFPSRHEPFGTVFVQSWAARRPFISSSAQGSSLFMLDGEDGLIFAIVSVPELNACLKRLMADKDLQNKLVENGFAKYQREFTKAGTVQLYLDHYTDVLAKNGLRPTV